MNTDYNDSTNHPAHTRQYKAEAVPDIPPDLYIYRPRELVVDGRGAGRFHYTRMVHSLGTVEPVGYCANSCPGHTSPEGARQHFRQFLIDKRLLLLEIPAEVAQQTEDPWPCEICGRTAARAAWVFYSADFGIPPVWQRYLCQEHYTEEQVIGSFEVRDRELPNWFRDPRTGELHTM